MLSKDGNQNAKDEDNGNASRVEAEIPIIELSNGISPERENEENLHKDQDSVKVSERIELVEVETKRTLIFIFFNLLSYSSSTNTLNYRKIMVKISFLFKKFI